MNLNQLYQLNINTVFNVIKKGQLPAPENDPTAPQANADSFVSTRADEDDPCINDLIKTFSNSRNNISDRQDALRELISRGDKYPQSVRDRAIAPLINLINNRDTPSELLGSTVAALGYVTSGSSQTDKNRAVTALIPLLDHHDWSVQHNAAQELGDLAQDSSEAIIGLVPLLKSEFKIVKDSAQQSINKIISESQDKASLLTPLLNSKNKSVKEFALGELTKIGEYSPESLVPFLDIDDRLVREITLQLLVRKTDSPAVISSLIDALKNPKFKNKIAAMNILDIAASIGRLSEESSEECVTALIPLAQGNDKVVRSFAARTLGSIGVISGNPVKKEISQILIPFLKDNDSDVRESAAGALGNINQNSSELVKKEISQILIPFLKDNDSGVRRSAVGALGNINQNSPEPVKREISQILIPLLKDNNSGVRGSAVNALGNINQNSSELVKKEISQILIPLLKDSNLVVRESAVGVLARINQNSPELVKKEISQILIPLLYDSDGFVRGNAALALGQIGYNSPEVVNALVSVFNDAKVDMFGKENAIIALGNMGHVVQIELKQLIPFLNSTQSIVQESAAKIIGNAGQRSTELARVLIPLLKDEESKVRAAAATALGQVGQGSDEEIKLLIGALSDQERDVRDAAATGLIHMGKPAVPHLIKRFEDISPSTVFSILRNIGAESIDDLTAALSYENSVVRGNSAQVLGAIMGLDGVTVSQERTDKVIAGIVNIISASKVDRNTKIAAIQALANLGSEARSAIPLLTSIANNDQLHEDIITAANEALEQIKQR